MCGIEEKSGDAVEVVVSCYMEGNGTRMEKELALEIILRRAPHVVVGDEVFFFEKFKVLKD